MSGYCVVHGHMRFLGTIPVCALCFRPLEVGPDSGDHREASEGRDEPNPSSPQPPTQLSGPHVPEIYTITATYGRHWDSLQGTRWGLLPDGEDDAA